MVRPKFTIPIEEAHKRIDLQLRQGRTIQKYNIFSESDLKAANIQRSKWYDKTKNLLELIDDNQILVKQFHYLTPTLSSGERDLDEMVHDFRYRMDKDLKNLQSIYDSIDLLKDLKIHKTKIKNTKKPRNLTHAQEKKCWDLNPHMCNLCGRKLHGISDTEFEHTQAFAKGGATDLTNVKLSHRSCNTQKGTKSLKVARKMLGYHKNIKKSLIELKLLKKKSTRKNMMHNFTLEKFFENGKEYVRILHPSKTVEACLILCNKDPCKWWDDNSILPRHIRSGGGGNVLLPQDVGNTNPTITVMSGKRAIRKMKLKDMVLTHP
ncbi:HNH endonuclease [Nitrosotalea sinensis]|uniref:HNH endonuclease n=1 Tax=Nitrosotalea sinensis TaxID=1499975 RepID=A0A2H1EJ04_9ARCH|nr:HNH endonuclease signature motif containing protein [Candidatus Nitrosotalea sinensis]SHO47625.1 HNH endonuclease [Candidatus Nitrosotalea sinensis]